MPHEVISISRNNMDLLKAEEGDLVYMADSRWYLGGLRSEHVKCQDLTPFWVQAP